MIVECPNCHTRFNAPDRAIGPQGRRLRCSRCHHTWHFVPPDKDPAAAFPVEATMAFAGLDDDGLGTHTKEFVAFGTDSEPVVGARRPLWQRPVVQWAGLGLTVLALLGLLVVFRNGLVAVLPTAEPIYTALGLPVTRCGQGLDFQNVRSVVDAADDGIVLAVDGLVVNISEEERCVPPITLMLLDADGLMVDIWTAMPTPDTLYPGEIATFEAAGTNPGPVTEVEIAFQR